MSKPRDLLDKTGPSIPRRTLLRALTSAAGGFVLVGAIPGLPGLHAQTDSGTNTPFKPNAFIRIDPDGTITFVMRNVEMGQGIYTGIAMLLAEELEVSLDRLTVEAAPADPLLYADAAAGEEVTGGSASTRDNWVPLRKAGASARVMLIAAAAEQWNVPVDTCHATKGQVYHAASGRSSPYGALTQAAARQPVPEDVPLKPASAFTLIGTNPQRVDTKAKSDGSARFGIDARLPGMKYGRIIACPVKGGTLRDCDEQAARSVKGVSAVLRLPDAIAVIGEHSWAAIKGGELARPQWNFGSNESVSTADLIRQLADASGKQGVVAKSVGHVSEALASAQHKIDTVYQLPFLAHAAMEPINTTLHIRPDGADVWVGTQVPVRARQEVADVTGLKPETINVHNHVIGGGFGRRLDATSIGQAAAFARQVSFPVKLFWTREEDIQHDQFRPYYYDRVSAGLDTAGKISGWHHRTTGSFVLARWMPEAMKDGLDSDAVDGALETPYKISAQKNEAVQCEPSALTTLWWRGVGPTHNVFVVESMIDELAHAAGKDPLAFRRDVLGSDPRARKVLDEAAQRSGWGMPLPRGQGRGIALHYAFQTWAATVLEISVSDDGVITLLRAHSAVDCGPVVFPDAVKAQIQGGLIFGLTMAMYNEITLKNGQIQQSNFNNYRMLRISDAPEVHVHLVSDPDAQIGGIGEVGTVSAAPALANAIFAATGHRLRRIPFALQLAEMHAA